VPDPASVGQHLHDAAAEMARRGWQVTVLTASRGYENPTVRLSRVEARDGVHIRRLPLSSFGKSSILRRLLGGMLFLLQACVRVLLGKSPDVVLITTSPPMAGPAGALLARLKRARLVFWAMDINPDQLIAVGGIGPKSLAARLFDFGNRILLRRCARVVALDRFMRRTLLAKCQPPCAIDLMPPWPHVEGVDSPLSHELNPFRERHGLEGKFVLMYSGNLSPVHPVETVLDAAERLRGEEDFVFLFVGGGLGRRALEDAVAERQLGNVRFLPYQPIEALRESLSAADVHLVSMGEAMVGVVHPCKIYGAMAVGRPILALAPPQSHVGEIVEGAKIGARIDHGDVEACLAALRQFASMSETSLEKLGIRAQSEASNRYSRKLLRSAFCDVLERA